MIDVMHFLDSLGIPYKELGKDLKLKCFFHEDRNPSFSISKDEGLWHCFSCKRSGNIYTLVAELTGAKGIEALDIIKDLETLDSTEDTIKKQIIDIVAPTPGIEQEVILPQYRALLSHPYLMQRGLTESEIVFWGMGEVSEEPYRGWIIVPIYQYSKLQNYFLRSTTNNRKIYGKYSIGHVFAGLDSAADTNKTLYIVEGIFDMIFLRRMGVQVVASLTNRLYEPHMNILKKYDHIVIVPDNDDPGWELVDNASGLLPYVRNLGVAMPPSSKKDCADCTLRELYNIVNTQQQLLDFICKEEFISWKLRRSRLQTLTA